MQLRRRLQPRSRLRKSRLLLRSKPTLATLKIPRSQRLIRTIPLLKKMQRRRLPQRSLLRKNPALMKRSRSRSLSSKTQMIPLTRLLKRLPRKFQPRRLRRRTSLLIPRRRSQLRSRLKALQMPKRRRRLRRNQPRKI